MRTFAAHAFRYTTSLPSQRAAAAGSVRASPALPAPDGRRHARGAINAASRTTDAIGDDVASGVSQSNEAVNRSQRSRRDRRESTEKKQQQGKGLLDWETFDFSDK